jgi:hypothetical protein
MAITRNVQFHKEEQWDWGDSQINELLEDQIKLQF